MNPGKAPSYQLLRWLFGSVVGILFIIGIIYQYQASTSKGLGGRTKMLDLGDANSSSGGESQDAKMRSAMEALKSADEHERAAALDAVMALDSAKGGPMVLAMMSDPSSLVKLHAIEIAHTGMIPGTGPQLAQLLNDADPAVRASAAKTILFFAAEPGIANLLPTALLSPDPSIQGPAVEAWKAVFPHDRAGCMAGISTVLGSGNADMIANVLSFLSPQLTEQDKINMKGILSGIQSRFAGQPAGAIAGSILASMPAGT